MAGTPQFAEFVATLSADDAELQRDLKAAETTTKQSATRMQRSLDGLKVSAGNLGGVMGTLSQAGASVGGSFGGIVGQGVAATQAIAGMTAVVSGPVGLLAGLAALTVGVVAYREEAANWLNSMLQSIGVLEDLDAALAEVEARNKVQLTRLEKQEAAEKRLNIERQQTIRMLNAIRTNNPEVVADTQRQISMEKRIAQELAAGTGRNAIDTIEAIFDANKRIEDSKKRQLEDSKKAQQIQQDDLKNAREMQTLVASQRSAAQALLVSVGGAVPSDFITDPKLKRIAQLSELLASRREEAAKIAPTAAATGTITSRDARSRFAIIRAGEVLGRQQLTVEEETKKVAEDHRDISRQIRDIMSDIWAATNQPGMGPFQVVEG
jgi:hypothetical protein